MPVTLESVMDALGQVIDPEIRRPITDLNMVTPDLVTIDGSSVAIKVLVTSGKGGVGKSSMTANLAAALAAQGLKVGVMDADIYGFSIPRMLGVDHDPQVIDGMMIPPVGVGGIKVISIGMFVPDGQAVVWRGPMLHRALQQFLADVFWGDLDVLLIDMPPGTGDVAISIAQLLPNSEILVVTTPQVAAAEVAERAGSIAAQTNQKVIGVVENMSFLPQPDGSGSPPSGTDKPRQRVHHGLVLIDEAVVASRRVPPFLGPSARTRFGVVSFLAGDRSANAPASHLACTLRAGEVRTRVDAPTRGDRGNVRIAMADKAQTWVYTEDYVAESNALAAARAVASELGAAPVSSGTGAALRMLAAVAGARAVLEVGTGAGVSGLWLLDGMARDGVLTTIDVESELLGYARRNFAAAGLSSHRTRLIAGRALDVLPRMAARGYDMVVLDGDLDETPQYLDHAVRIVRPGGTIAFVHALWHDQVADPARRDARTVVAREVVNYLRDSDEFVPTLLPVGDGLAVAVKR